MASVLADNRRNDVSDLYFFCGNSLEHCQYLNNEQLKYLFFFIQGEKAYSCAQCGTRFTYRNGLIKHTKLNRCPKKAQTNNNNNNHDKESFSSTPLATGVRKRRRSAAGRGAYAAKVPRKEEDVATTVPKAIPIIVGAATGLQQQNNVQSSREDKEVFRSNLRNVRIIYTYFISSRFAPSPAPPLPPSSMLRTARG